jgi:DNA-binding CsgD family transcriptional regulator
MLTAGLRQAIAAGLSAGVDPSPSSAALASDGVFPLSRPSGRRPLAAFIVPLPRRTREIWAMALPLAQAIVFVLDPDQEQELLPETLRRLYGLTPREARLAVEISRGEGLQTAADFIGVAKATARTHLLRIFAKTRHTASGRPRPARRTPEIHVTGVTPHVVGCTPRHV